MKIALLGYGTVAKGILEILEKNQEELYCRAGKKMSIEKILVRNHRKQELGKKEDPRFVTSIEEVIEDPEISVVIEVIGGQEPAAEYIKKSLRAGKHVVSANKLLIALEGEKILGIAKEKGVKFLYEASVGGGIPVIRMIEDGLNANRMTRITGIINGTTNYILSKMSQNGMSYEEALREAQEKGYAEADPAADIEGKDAIYKLAILSSLAFEGTVEYKKIYRQGITQISSEDIRYADQYGYVIKLLGIVQKEAEKVISARVHPAFISKDHPLASISGSLNGILVEGNAVDHIMISGPGAGALPTGSAIWSDVLNIARERQSIFSCPDKAGRLEILPMEEKSFRYYIHLKAEDTYGVMSEITDIFGKNEISILAMKQEEVKGKIATLIFITHQTKERGMNQALASLRKMDRLYQIANVIRIEP